MIDFLFMINSLAAVSGTPEANFGNYVSQFSHCAPKISFDASLWSSSEGINNQTFSIQYMRPDGYWQSYISYDLNNFKTNKDLKKTYKVLMPKDVTRIRFYSSTPQPESDRNKGRIVLDNFVVNYM